MLLGATYATWDYQRIVQIFAPYGEGKRQPLADRIAEGRKSHLFGHHADFAAVTTAARPSEVFDAFDRPLQHLIDARLMIAYARALHERGEEDKALHVVQRLREFRHPMGKKFLADCEKPASAASAASAPFQCQAGKDFPSFEPLLPNWR
jgi:hypothetical protein